MYLQIPYRFKVSKTFTYTVIIILILITQISDTLAQYQTKKHSYKNIKTTYLDRSALNFQEYPYRWNSKNHIDDSILEEKTRYKSSFSDTAHGVQLLGKWWHGSCEGVAVIDSNHVIIGNGQLIQILKVSDIEPPEVIGEIIVNGRTTDIVIRGIYAYVIDSGALDIIDISDITQPILVRTFLDGIYDRLIQIDKRGWPYLYIGGDTFTILDITDPINPQTVVNLGVYSYIWWDMEQYMTLDSGLYIYAQNNEGFWFEVFDLTDPNNPGRGTIDLELVFSFAIKDHYLYVDNPPLLRVYDITDPMNPDSVTWILLPSVSYDMSILGDSLYAATNGKDGWVYVIDVYNPEIPVLVDSLRYPGPSVGHLAAELKKVVVQDERLYLATSISLWGVKVQTGIGLSTWLDYHTGGFRVEQIVCDGDLTYLAFGWSGLWIMDTSDPINPTSIGDVQTPQYAKNLVMLDSVIFIKHGFSITAIDISNPEYPFIISTLDSLPHSGYSYKMAVKSGFLYTPSDYGLLIVNVQNPAQMFLESVYPLIEASDVYVTDTLLFVTKGIFDYPSGNGLHIFNISDPQSPVEISLYNQWAGARLVKVKQNYAYVTTICIKGQPACNAFAILDISDPSNPVEIARKDSIFEQTNAYFSKMSISEDWAYHTWDSTYIIDISNSQNPELRGNFEGKRCVDVCRQTIEGDIIYVGHDIGVSIYRNDMLTGIYKKPNSGINNKFYMTQNYPNPFNNVTNFSFILGKKDQVVLKIYDITGKEIRTIVNNELAAGKHIVNWTGINNSGNTVGSGIYFYQLHLKSTGITKTKKLLLIK